MKKYFILAAAALAFAACTNDEIVPVEQTQQTVVAEKGITFDVYTSRGVSRAGHDGVLTTNSGATHAIKLTMEGFGVFGYYTDGDNYAGLTKPNFFYNQQVTDKDAIGNWTYAPIKYWPNEFGDDAVSDQVDRLSLYAYAPWVDVDPVSGIVKGDQTTNITGMTRNTATGDPFIKYVATLDATNAVDLCYGVAAEDFTSSNSVVNPNNITKGKVYTDVVKPDLNGKIKYDFKHALSQLVVTIDAPVNSALPGATNVDTEHSRIWVRSITFEGFAQKGQLNLKECQWFDMSGSNQLTSGTLTVYDGRKDGKEGTSAANNETPASFNPRIVQGDVYTLDGSGKISASTELGVTNTPVNLFKSADGSDPVFVIPTDETLRVTIVYDVETVDEKLSTTLSDGKTKGSSIENTISKEITAIGSTKPGVKYELKLHLGMRTVDFEAAVTDWEEREMDVHLPYNIPTYAAAASSTTAIATAYIPASATSYQFAVNGFTPSETVTATEDGTYITTASVENDKADDGGYAVITGSFADVNSTTDEVSGTVTLAGSASTKGGIMTIKQKAHALGLTGSTTGMIVTLAAGAGVTTTWTDIAEATTILKNKLVVYGADGTTALSAGYTWDNSAKTVTFTNHGTYYIEVQAGDAAPERIRVVL